MYTPYNSGLKLRNAFHTTLHNRI